MKGQDKNGYYYNKKTHQQPTQSYAGKPDYYEQTGARPQDRPQTKTGAKYSKSAAHGPKQRQDTYGHYGAEQYDYYQHDPYAYGNEYYGYGEEYYDYGVEYPRPESKKQASKAPSSQPDPTKRSESAQYETRPKKQQPKTQSAESYKYVKVQRSDQARQQYPVHQHQESHEHEKPAALAEHSARQKAEKDVFVGEQDKRSEAESQTSHRQVSRRTHESDRNEDFRHIRGGRQRGTRGTRGARGGMRPQTAHHEPQFENATNPDTAHQPARPKTSRGGRPQPAARTRPE